MYYGTFWKAGNRDDIVDRLSLFRGGHKHRFDCNANFSDMYN